MLGLRELRGGGAMNAKIQELLEELEHDNPRPEEAWRQEEDWDPEFARGTLRRAEAQGLIEIDRADPEDWRFRFTGKGRDKAAAMAGTILPPGGKP